jgi:hypothetical protein
MGVSLLRLIIPRPLITRSWAFLRKQGLVGQEAMLLWAGQRRDDMAILTRLVIPAQIAIRSHFGVCVAMDRTAQFELHKALKPGETFFARVHSHPEDAYHSDTDDENLILSHDGALSLVIPYFAKYVADDLNDAAIYEYSQVRGWQPLTRHDIAARFQIR